MLVRISFIMQFPKDYQELYSPFSKSSIYCRNLKQSILWTLGKKNSNNCKLQTITSLGFSLLIMLFQFLCSFTCSKLAFFVPSFQGFFQNLLKQKTVSQANPGIYIRPLEAAIELLQDTNPRVQVSITNMKSPTPARIHNNAETASRMPRCNLKYLQWQLNIFAEES